MAEVPETVAVLLGGASSEAAVSRTSGAGIVDVLTPRFRRVVALELDAGLASALPALRPDVVFPAVHGSPGEDGTLQGFLTLLGLPFVGSAVTASAVAMHKPLAKTIFAAAGLPVAPGLVVRNDSERPPASAVIERLGTSVVLKPSAQGSALGVRFANGAAAIDAALDQALEADGETLIEPRIDGRELTVGVLDLEGEAARALPVIEVRTPEDSWYDYEHRYTPGLSEHLLPAPVPAAVAAEAARIAMAAHAALGCRDLSRADFIYAPDTAMPLTLLEVNTLPGMTPTSLYPDAAAAIDIPFAELCERLVLSAHRRR